MRKTLLLAATASLVATAGTAVAQDADTTPPDAVLSINTKLQTIDSMIGGGLTFSADPSEDLTYTGTASITSHGKKVVVAKSIRAGDLYNQSGGFIEASIPRASDRAVKALVKIPKGKKTAVTLTLKLKDTAGNKKTISKTVKLKKYYPAG